MNEELLHHLQIGRYSKSIEYNFTLGADPYNKEQSILQTYLPRNESYYLDYYTDLSSDEVIETFKKYGIIIKNIRQ